MVVLTTRHVPTGESLRGQQRPYGRAFDWLRCALSMGAAAVPSRIQRSAGAAGAAPCSPPTKDPKLLGKPGSAACSGHWPQRPPGLQPCAGFGIKKLNGRYGLLGVELLASHSSSKGAQRPASGRRRLPTGPGLEGRGRGGRQRRRPGSDWPVRQRQRLWRALPPSSPPRWGGHGCPGWFAAASQQSRCQRLIPAVEVYPPAAVPAR